MTQVFISYSRRDLSFVERLARDLKNSGLEVWYDLSGLEGGQRWGSEIQDAIQKSQVFIIVLSPHSVASEWVEKEFMYAHNLGRKIIPVLYEKCAAPMWVSNLHFIDMQKGSYQSNLAPLLGILGVDTWMEKGTPSARIDKEQSEPSSNRKRKRLTLAFALGGPIFMGLVVTAVALLWGKEIAAAIIPANTATPTMTITSTSTSTRAPSSTFTPSPTFTPTLGIGSTMIRPSDGMTMVYVPAGQFTMGRPYDNSTIPVHQVNLDAYWIDQTEVTNAMYSLCVRDGQCSVPYLDGSATRSSYYSSPEYGNYPVIYVDWWDAMNYCDWAGARLPTEAEWEKAARGTDERIYPWSNPEGGDGCSLANFLISFSTHCVGDTASVGSYPLGASPYGALDMAGNVTEWVADWFGFYPSSLVTNPTGPATGTLKIMRGGSWEANEVKCYSFSRCCGRDPDLKQYDWGFRCAVSP